MFDGKSHGFPVDDPQQNQSWLVVFRPTPLKNDGVRQLG